MKAGCVGGLSSSSSSRVFSCRSSRNEPALPAQTHAGSALCDADACMLFAMRLMSYRLPLAAGAATYLSCCFCCLFLLVLQWLGRTRWRCIQRQGPHQGGQVRRIHRPPGSQVSGGCRPGPPLPGAGEGMSRNCRDGACARAAAGSTGFGSTGRCMMCSSTTLSPKDLVLAMLLCLCHPPLKDLLTKLHIC